MTDPIKDALRAAALAGMNPAERDHADRHHNGEPGPGNISEAARTVAAFHFHLAERWFAMGQTGPAVAATEMGAAVEDAALDA